MPAGDGGGVPEVVAMGMAPRVVVLVLLDKDEEWERYWDRVCDGDGGIVAAAGKASIASLGETETLLRLVLVLVLVLRVRQGVIVS